MSKDTAAIRDQLGKDPDETFFLDADYFESVGTEEQTLTIGTQSNVDTWVVGSSTNGIVGTWTGTTGGGQLVVGVTHLPIEIIRVVNPNNTFREHFRDTDFQDLDDDNTADWNTTIFRIAMTTASSHGTVYNTIATFKTIFLNVQTIIRATVNSTETKWNPSDKITYLLSADGGGSWEEFKLGIERVFTNTGIELKVKIQFFGNGAKDTYIEDLQVSYEV